jgi:hypothetical protein
MPYPGKIIIEEFKEYHKSYFNYINKNNFKLSLKTLYNDHFSLFENELDRDNILYIEFVDKDNNPLDKYRGLYKFTLIKNLNSYSKKTSINNNIFYLIPKDEIEFIKDDNSIIEINKPTNYLDNIAKDLIEEANKIKKQHDEIMYNFIKKLEKLKDLT